MNRKEKIQLINEYLSGMPIIDQHTMFAVIEGEDWAEDTHTGRKYAIDSIKGKYFIIYLKNRKELEIIQRL